MMLPTTFLTSNNCTGIIGFGDLHIEGDSLEEIAEIIAEIIYLGKKYNCSHCFQLGDLCDKIRLYPKELFELVRNIIKLRDSFSFVGILEGNHDKESTEISIISFLDLIGVKICEDETMLDTNFGKFLLGHWFLEESNDAFGTHQRYSLAELKKKYTYDYCFLGHQHDFQRIDPTTVHLGSSRYVNFGEHPEIKKPVFIINQDGIQFIELKSVTPIYNVSSIAELEKLPAKSKVRYIFKSFINQLNETKAIEKYRDRFVSFKTKLDFTNKTLINTSQEPITKKNQNQIIENWLKQVQDSEVRAILEEEFKKEIK